MANTAFRTRRREAGSGSPTGGPRQKLRFEGASDGSRTTVLDHQKPGTAPVRTGPDVIPPPHNVDHSASAEAQKQARLKRLQSEAVPAPPEKHRPPQAPSIPRKVPLVVEQHLEEPTQEPDPAEWKAAPAAPAFEAPDLSDLGEFGLVESDQEGLDHLITFLGGSKRSITSAPDETGDDGMAELLAALEELPEAGPDASATEAPSGPAPVASDPVRTAPARFEPDLDLSGTEPESERDLGSFVAQTISDWQCKYGVGMSTPFEQGVGIYYVPKSDRAEFQGLLRTLRQYYRSGVLKVRPILNETVYSSLFWEVLKRNYQMQNKGLLRIPIAHYVDRSGTRHYMGLLDQQVRVGSEEHYILVEFVYDSDSKLILTVEAFVLVSTKVIFAVN